MQKKPDQAMQNALAVVRNAGKAMPVSTRIMGGPKPEVPKMKETPLKRQGDVLSGYRDASKKGNLGGSGWGGK